MKIAYIVSEISLSGGLEKMILVQTDYFIKKFKYEIDIILLHEKSYASNPKYHVNENIKLHYLDIISRGPKKFFHRVIAVNRKLKQINPDIVMVCSDEVFEMNLASLVKKRQPFIYQRHSSKKTNFVQRDGKKLNMIKYYLKKIILSRSGLGYDKVVLLSEEHKKDWPHLISKTEIINNPIVLSTEGKRAKLDNKIVIAVGRQDHVKGYDMLLEAWQKVIEKNADWTLKFYGRVNKSLELEKITENLGLINNVQIHEHTKDIISAYLEASMLVCSSRTEGFPLVFIEAMSLGLPVVSFDCPYGPRAIITDSEDGILVEANNIEKLSESLISLINNDKLRKSMGSKAINNVKRFDLDKVMKNWKLLFEEVLLD